MDHRHRRSDVRRGLGGAATLLVLLGAGPLPAQGPAPAGSLSLADAISRALELDARIAQARWTREASLGTMLQMQAAYDGALSATAERSNTGVASGGGTATSLEYGLGLTQRLPWGVVAEPHVGLRRTPGEGGVETIYNAASTGLDLSLPLLRDRGGRAAAAAVEWADWTHTASTSALEHQRAASVLGVAQAYWGFAAAMRRVGLLREGELRAARLVEETRALIAADERPAADEIRVRANYASKRSDQVAGEQALMEARAALADAMGVSVTEMTSLEAAATALPDLQDESLLPTAAAASELALGRRRDLSAAEREARAAGALLSGARSQAPPRLDLTVGLSYAGTAVGTPLTALSAGRGVRGTVGLSFGLPIRNRAAEGLALQERASWRQAEIARDELGRKIALQAAVAAERLCSASEELTRAHEAAALYAQAVKSEEARFRLGTSTLFDLLYAQDALTAATLAELTAQLGYASALARLRYETGTLFQDTGETAAVDLAGMTAWSQPTPKQGVSAPRPR